MPIVSMIGPLVTGTIVARMIVAGPQLMLEGRLIGRQRS
jgi:hypothetical protein